MQQFYRNGRNGNFLKEYNVENYGKYSTLGLYRVIKGVLGKQYFEIEGSQLSNGVYVIRLDEDGHTNCGQRVIGPHVNIQKIGGKNPNIHLMCQEEETKYLGFLWDKLLGGSREKDGFLDVGNV